MKKLNREDKLLLSVFLVSTFISFYLGNDFLVYSSDWTKLLVFIGIRLFLGIVIAFFTMTLFHIIYHLMKWVNYEKYKNNN